jgi:hypothetical protein
VPRAAAATRAKLILRNMTMSPLVGDGRSAHPVHMSRSALRPFTGSGRITNLSRRGQSRVTYLLSFALKRQMHEAVSASGNSLKNVCYDMKLLELTVRPSMMSAP